MKRDKRAKGEGYKVFLLYAVFLFCAGCEAVIKEPLRGIAGISTKVLEDQRPSAVSQEFNLGYSAAYSKTLDILKGMQTYIYALDQAKNLIAVYVSEKDTTPVGIFFKETAGGKTQVQVSSPSQYAKESISKKLFTGLEK